MKKPRTTFALGTHVVFTHRAAVARRYDLTWAEHDCAWELFEGAGTEGGYGKISPVPLISSLDLLARPYGELDESLPASWNKIVHIWPEEGSGVITGLVKRQEGISHKHSTSRGLDGEDFEPGYFIVKNDVWLYVVRTQLEGKAYLLVPIGATRLPIPPQEAT